MKDKRNVKRKSDVSILLGEATVRKDLRNKRTNEVDVTMDGGDSTDTGDDSSGWTLLDKFSTKLSRMTNKNDIIALYDQLVRDVLASARYSKSDMTALLKDTLASV